MGNRWQMSSHDSCRIQFLTMYKYLTVNFSVIEPLFTSARVERVLCLHKHEILDEPRDKRILLK